MSLLGIGRYLTEVEAYWLRVGLSDEQDVSGDYCTPREPDGDFDEAGPGTAADVAAYRAELAVTRANAATRTDLPRRSPAADGLDRTGPT